MHRPLADFLEQLEEAGELARISVEVDPNLEISEITSRVASANGPALLFERVRGQQWPVVTNLLGTQQRICKALRIQRIEDLADRARATLWPQDQAWLDRLKLSSRAPSLASLRPRTVKSAACQQVVRLGRDVDLGNLPLLRSWPNDAGPMIAAGRLFCRSAETGQHSVGEFFFQRMDSGRLAVHWHPLQSAPRILAQFAARAQKMPVAVVLGGDPMYALLAGAALPTEVDECLWGGILSGAPMELVKCRTQELEVPSDAEIVLEGFIDPLEPSVAVGPFGGPDGFEAPVRSGPVLHITAITHRSNPLYVATVAGRPPHELSRIKHAVQRASLPMIQALVPDLVDYVVPSNTGPSAMAFVAIRKRHPLHARQVAAALWGLEYLMLNKLIVLVDESVNIHDANNVLFAIGAHVDPSRDLISHFGPSDVWDHAAATPLQGHHLAIDATAKWPDERSRPPAAELAMTAEVRELVSSRWASFGIPQITENS